jgi:hypothetical protein
LKIERHLIVSTAAGVHLASDRPNDFGQASLDRHVHVFIRKSPGEYSLLYLVLQQS